jgi:hypothetical protein
MNTMAQLTIDGKTYDQDSLTREAKQQLVMLRACEAEIQRLNMLLAVARTAQTAYAIALKEQLPQAAQPN